MAAGFKHLGCEWQVPEDLLELRESFVYMMYQPGRSVCTKINDLSYQLFAAKAAQSQQLPPTHDALAHHILTANNQAGIWLRALRGKPVIPAPAGHGWVMVEDALTVA